jgi:hypothetical protein
MSSYLRASWSIIQAARATGESASPYNVCGRNAISVAYPMPFVWRNFSCSHARLSSADSPDGAGSPDASAVATPDASVAASGLSGVLVMRELLRLRLVA